MQRILLTALITLHALHASALDTHVPMEASGRSTFIVDGKIPGFKSETFLVDTGAAFTTITRNAAETLEKQGKAEYLRSMEAVYADGSTAEIRIYRLDEMTIGEDCKLSNVEVAVIPGASGKHCLLGLSALKQAAPFSFSIEPPGLHLSGCNKMHQEISANK